MPKIVFLLNFFIYQIINKIGLNTCADICRFIDLYFIQRKVQKVFYNLQLIKSYDMTKISLLKA